MLPSRPTRCVAIALLAIAATAAPASSHSCPNAHLNPSQLSVAQASESTLCLLNGERRARGLTNLRQSPKLRRAGRRHARDMVAHEYFAHDGRGGGHFDARIRRTGYLVGASRWTIGENLAWGTRDQATPAAIAKAWMRSPGHRRNILNGAYRDIGIAVVDGVPVPGTAPGATYATEFGRRW